MDTILSVVLLFTLRDVEYLVWGFLWVRAGCKPWTLNPKPSTPNPKP